MQSRRKQSEGDEGDESVCSVHNARDEPSDIYGYAAPPLINSRALIKSLIFPEIMNNKPVLHFGFISRQAS